MSPRVGRLLWRAAALSPWAALAAVVAYPYTLRLGTFVAGTFTWLARAVCLGLLGSLVAWPLVVPLDPAAAGRKWSTFIVGFAALVVVTWVLLRWGGDAYAD